MNKQDLHGESLISGIPQQSPNPNIKTTDVIKSNLDKILAVMSLEMKSSEDVNNLIDILVEETKYIDSVIMLRENGIYILVSNYISLCPIKIKELFFHHLIKRAPEFPFSAISLIDDEKLTFIPGIEEIPTIKRAMEIIDQKTFLRRTKKV